ncbi:conserved hypothetical protein [Hyella patelloides LEGE 07179]|uniref:DUF1824 family protein n=1 Tax=Hyella patelloides LEGE 07179 TaxID=945734 RepID=A0A563VUB1_9CYAN|nr:DUF1824 family protein [Hyella patelloides]VEP14993.1 conserved hypothetical protein [Hyella patelloides LEGE 07179]
MSESEMNTLTIADAVKLLKIYGCDTENQDNSPTAIKQLRKALLMVAQESEWENLGICADNLVQGLEALQSYLEALGYSYDFSQKDRKPENLEESVYIKFNTRKMNYYADTYTGNSRGVLVAMQGDDEAIIGTYGHFPLNLFNETSD